MLFPAAPEHGVGESAHHRPAQYRLRPTSLEQARVGELNADSKDTNVKKWITRFYPDSRSNPVIPFSPTDEIGMIDTLNPFGAEVGEARTFPMALKALDTVAYPDARREVLADQRVSDHRFCATSLAQRP